MSIALVALAVFILTPNIEDPILKVLLNTSSAPRQHQMPGARAIAQLIPQT